MKVTAFVGSARKKHTYHAAELFLTQLQALGAVDCEIVALSDYRLEPCIGCKLCFDKDEARCPLQDDRDALIAKMMASDGVVFASPTYDTEQGWFESDYYYPVRLGLLKKLAGKAFDGLAQVIS